MTFQLSDNWFLRGELYPIWNAEETIRDTFFHTLTIERKQLKEKLAIIGKGITMDNFPKISVWPLTSIVRNDRMRTKKV